MTLQAELRLAAAGVLRVRPESIDRRAPLARYGLDSLNAVELATAISSIAGRDFPDELLVDCSSLAAIEDYLAAKRRLFEEFDASLRYRLKQRRYLRDLARETQSHGA